MIPSDRRAQPWTVPMPTDSSYVTALVETSRRAVEHSRLDAHRAVTVLRESRELRRRADTSLARAREAMQDDEDRRR
jgi:hypothetical protein